MVSGMMRAWVVVRNHCRRSYPSPDGEASAALEQFRHKKSGPPDWRRKNHETDAGWPAPNSETYIFDPHAQAAFKKFPIPCYFVRFLL
jgi:hypothetical protein